MQRFCCSILNFSKFKQVYTLIGILFVFSFFSAKTAYAETDIDTPKPPACPCASHAHLQNLNQILACYPNQLCQNNRMELETAMRIKGRYLLEALKQYMALANNGQLRDEERHYVEQRIIEGKDHVDQITNLIEFTGHNKLLEPLYLDFDYPENNYHRQYHAFNLGFEYITFSEIFQRGFPRIGLMAYRRFGPTPIMREGIHYYGMHMRATLQLTSSGEQTGSEAETVLTNTLEADVETFVPLFHSLIRLDATLSDLIGPILSLGIRKRDDETRSRARVYLGFRNAINPETYFDALLGQSEGLASKRMELRLQLPMYKFANGSRIFFGGIVNMAIPGTDPKDDQDVVRFYLDWNADFEKIIEGLGGAVGI
ncbi:MAG: hypothetical protein OEY38_05380 [Gammaproteobacteria bacterium]|nr:hypothetical protein [Gammaproteobacteria bacterium]